MAKRLFDLSLALTLLLILSPLFLLVALAVRFRIGSPVLFTQTRPGYQGRPFNVQKFRTMTNERNQEGHLLSDEMRLTPLGQFLRKTSLDELPQLINVIRGDLSFVGPRPLLMEYLALYSDDQKRRHDVKPGITGWAQINGRNDISWERKFELDVWYVDNQSFWLDMKILVKTLMYVLKREGVSKQGHVTTTRFKGNGE